MLSHRLRCCKIGPKPRRTANTPAAMHNETLENLRTPKCKSWKPQQPATNQLAHYQKIYHHTSEILWIYKYHNICGKIAVAWAEDRWGQGQLDNKRTLGHLRDPNSKTTTKSRGAKKPVTWQGHGVQVNISEHDCRHTAQIRTQIGETYMHPVYLTSCMHIRGHQHTSCAHESHGPN